MHITPWRVGKVSYPGARLSLPAPSPLRGEGWGEGCSRLYASALSDYAYGSSDLHDYRLLAMEQHRGRGYPITRRDKGHLGIRDLVNGLPA